MSISTQNRTRFSPFFAICCCVLIAAALLPLPQNGAIAGLPPLCPFYSFTGLPCPGCGLTRSFVCCAHSHIVAAFAYHPLGPVLFAGALLFVANSVFWRFNWRFSNRHYLIFALVGGIFWVLRLGGLFPYPAA